MFEQAFNNIDNVLRKETAYVIAIMNIRGLA
jgi:hypothetical protein